MEPVIRNTIELNRVSTTSGEYEVLSRLTLTVREGQFIDLFGPTGCGKTTVLRVASGIQRPSSGSARVAGHDLSKLSGPALRRFRRRTVGFFSRELMPPDEDTLLDAVASPAVLCGHLLGRSHAMALDALSFCGLAELQDSRVGDLSEGERQLACLAQAIVHRPLIILADEPTAFLDTARALSVLALLSQYASRGGTILAVSLHPLSASYATAVDMEKLQHA